MLRNRAALDAATVVPSLPVPADAVDLSVDLFGLRYAAPIGIAPLGLAGIVHPHADTILARSAAEIGLPYVMSSTASTALEVVADAAGAAPWFQLYLPRREEDVFGLLARARGAGCRIAVLTVDMPVAGARMRDRRNGLRVDPPSPRMVLDAMLRPAWSLRRVRAGRLTFPNQPQSACAHGLSWQERLERQTGGRLTWDLLRGIRDAWPGALLLKGILCPETAAAAVEAGCDGIVVSNHGGRQLDCAPAAFDALGGVAAAVGDQAVALFDSGLRSGEDILKAVDQGAAAGFLGRPLLYALGAGGEAAVRAFLSDLIAETRRAYALAGRSPAPGPASEGGRAREPRFQPKGGSNRA